MKKTKKNNTKNPRLRREASLTAEGLLQQLVGNVVTADPLTDPSHRQHNHKAAYPVLPASG
ncbi:hypothetical protein [Streptomyces sp. IBSBF 2806]|uniref:hypothetical protein n=1 Tax=Streptomyces sp. IBSBF 2806 TaxID=2903529 RepID=UPI002FDC4182